MPNAADMQWFKDQFQSAAEPSLTGTPLTIDLITALACQETGEVWPILRKKGLPVADILRLCVGDTIDASGGRGAFPKTKADLLREPQGQAIFTLAHDALVEMAQHIPAYAQVARKPDKFCHGFGMFQRDLQFFKNDPDYFLDRNYAQFASTLGQCIDELKRALKKLGFDTRTSLSDLQLAAVGIAYNTGRFIPSKGLKQGFFDGSRFYGELLFDFIQLAHTVAPQAQTPALPPAADGAALLPLASPVTAQGPMFRVLTQDGMLRLRKAPEVSDPPQANVIAHLPVGHPVRAITGKRVKGFLEVETSLSGGLLRGFASAKFLEPEAHDTAVPVIDAEAAPPSTGIVAVYMPRKSGVTKRTGPANAHSLNEPRQPGRSGTTPAQLCDELAAIIAWLAVDDPAHQRYQPHSGLTFCNIYAHDYCHLAGVYLPRVWWTGKALTLLAQGKPVEPLYGDTIAEVRANDLFRWLRDFGIPFGWRQTGTLTKLQQAANQGGIGIIVARRKEDGKSGHIVMVVPETQEQTARRGADGEVTAPLQSQAGASNFQYGRGRANWWNGEEFAESAFWIHA
ncbi:hypothetical protein AWB67_01294 [Caballeronia terrestris]|uniref:SH3 domain-containing protein n=1 Tax=Caballeronia terrestris TaxID=1226301 RepID=A0A158GGB4_9BURK|nr:hypothetical protein [Caballeronia terrestris]SAL30947.1 hypothetical protein AWB67_01294 [Caballeronia terrestris]